MFTSKFPNSVALIKGIKFIVEYLVLVKMSWYQKFKKHRITYKHGEPQRKHFGPRQKNFKASLSTRGPS